MRGWVFVAGLLLGVGLVSAQDLKMGDGKAKLLLCDGMPCVEASIDGKKLTLAIDTGSASSVVDYSLIRDEGLDKTPHVGRDGKPAKGLSDSALPELKIGTIAVKDLPVLVASLGNARSGNQMPDVDGTLGYDAFKGKVLRIDFKKNTVEVSTGGVCEGGKTELVTFGKQGAPIVTSTGFTVEGKPVVAQVDTMFGGSMVVYPEAVEKLGLTDLTKTKAHEHFPFTDGGVDMLKAAAKEEFAGRAVGDGSVYFAGPGVKLPDGLFDATVGMKMFAGRVVVFDFGRGCFGVN